MLQRFRQGKDLGAFDQTPVVSPPDCDDSEEENAAPNKKVRASQQSQYKWWHETDMEAVRQTVAKRKKEATKKVEHDRYIKALKALIFDKNSGPGEASEWRDRFFEGMEQQLQASNS